LRAVWWLFANVRFAIVLLAVLCIASLIGVLLPQMPINVRGDAVAETAWLKTQEGNFGLLTPALDRVELFDIFHARWFGVLLALTSVATAVYVVSRLPGVYRAITQPRKRVPDRYFEMAPNRVEVAGGLDAERLANVFRRARYSVERMEEDGTVYLFADRFAWAQFGSLLTHVAVIVFILAAIVSKTYAFESPLFLSEGATLPVFPVRDEDQIQVELRNATGNFAADGRPVDYRADLTLYRRGEEVKQCASTVNTPCSFDGYKFYQSAYFGFGAGIEVVDLAGGNVIYRETLVLSDVARSPHVRISTADGAVLLDEAPVLTDELDGGTFTYRGTIRELPDGRLLTIGLQSAEDGEEHLAVLEAGEGDGLVRLSLAEGESADSGGLHVAYQATVGNPSATVDAVPVPGREGGNGASGELALQFSNVVYGTARTSGDDAVDSAPAAGPPRLTITGLTPQAVDLRPGESAEVGGYRYTFLGQREFAGITVRRDRSDYLIWVGVLLIILGLVATFWVPRRRLWARITSSRAWLAGQAPSHARYAREMRSLVVTAGGSIPEAKNRK
jgi:cytochrome c biogenesis protein ResB